MRVCFPGAAANVFWQMGGVQYVQHQPWFASVIFRGASAGAISCAMAACSVPVEKSIRRAYEVADAYGADLNPFGVFGTWGAMIRDWLDLTLPLECARMCTGRVEVLLRAMPSMRVIVVRSFTSKADLIDAIMASCHIPFALDMRPCAMFRGSWYVDGQLGVSDADLSRGCDAVLTYKRDARYVCPGRLKYRSLGESLRSSRMGHRFAERLFTDEVLRRSCAGPDRRHLRRPPREKVERDGSLGSADQERGDRDP